MRSLMTTTKDTKYKVTEKDRKKYGACEHGQVNYKSLIKLNNLLYKRTKSDQKQFKFLAQDIFFKNKHIEDLKQINEDLVDRYEDKLEEYEKANEDLKKANTQLILDVEELKRRLFGSFERRLKDIALRPDRKKDN